MKKVRKVLGVTATRSDYDLLSYLYRYLSVDSKIDFRLLVSGSHLSPTFGMTIHSIFDDRLPILAKIETLLDGDSDATRLKSAAIFLQDAITFVQEYSPDLMIFAGDREDVIMASLIGGYLKIPTMHFFAGDHDNDGLIDNPVRHATSKLSTYKVVSLPEHKDRLLALGENPERIFVIGSPALDKFVEEEWISSQSVLSEIASEKQNVFDDYALVIFHPLMDHEDESIETMCRILDALIELEINAVINVPNIDPGARRLMCVTKKYESYESFIFVNNIQRKYFVNLYRSALFQIGNSSSGILEAASIPIPAINVGRRMQGRRAQPNVIFSGDSTEEIISNIKLATSQAFRDEIKGLKNIYGDGKASRRAFDIIANLNVSNFAEFRKEDPLDFVHWDKR